MCLIFAAKFGHKTEICSNFYEIWHSYQIEHYEYNTNYEYNTHQCLEGSRDYLLRIVCSEWL